jgi:hypothetical protein
LQYLLFLLRRKVLAICRKSIVVVLPYRCLLKNEAPVLRSGGKRAVSVGWETAKFCDHASGGVRRKNEQEAQCDVGSVG